MSIFVLSVPINKERMLGRFLEGVDIIVLGITLGLMLLVCILSVFNGGTLEGMNPLNLLVVLVLLRSLIKLNLSRTGGKLFREV